MQVGSNIHQLLNAYLYNGGKGVPRTANNFHAKLVKAGSPENKRKPTEGKTGEKALEWLNDGIYSYPWWIRSKKQAR
jgi:hypothetical protein